MPKSSFSEGFLKPKKDGKGDPRLKYKAGDVIPLANIGFQSGVFMGMGGSTGYTMGAAHCPMHSANYGIVACTNQNGYFIIFTTTRGSVYSIAYQIGTSNLYANFFTSVAVDENDTVYLQTSSAGGTRKFNANGNYLSVENTGAVGYSMTCDKKGGLYYLSGSGGNLIKLNYSLVQQWSNPITNVYYCYADKISKDGGVFYTTNPGNIIGRRKADGTADWTYTLPSTGVQIHQDESGFIYVNVGSSIVKLTDRGEFVWQSPVIASSLGQFVVDSVGKRIYWLNSAKSSKLAILDTETGLEIPQTSLSGNWKDPASSQSNIPAMQLVNNDIAYMDNSTYLNIWRVNGVLS